MYLYIYIVFIAGFLMYKALHILPGHSRHFKLYTIKHYQNNNNNNNNNDIATHNTAEITE